MTFAIALMSLFLIVFLVLALLLIRVLHSSNEPYDPNHQTLPPQSKPAHLSWKEKVSRMLVMRPWLYKDLWNPLNRLYWPDEQVNNRPQRRRMRRKEQR